MSSIAVGRARHFEYRLVLLTAGLVALGLGVARADFTPLTLTSGSYNQDVVVEKTATTPVTPGGATTASMDGGINNDGDTWNEQGFFADNPEVGLPSAGSVVITNLNGVSYSFQLAPSYTANNAIMLDSSFFTNTTFTLSTPTAFGKLSVLTSGGNGGCQFRVTAHHLDGTVSVATGASPDWFSVPNNIVWIANGRVNAQSFALDNLNSNNPRLYAVDLPLSNTTSPITNLVIEWVSGNGSGHSAIMAISGQASGGGNFTPIAGTGYNADIVVEASAPQSQPLTGTTTVTMDAGLGNADATWYEHGYSMAAPATGLPAAGSTLSSNISGVTYSFVLPASYAANNAIFLDAGSSNATLTLATPAALGGLSFLTAAGNGPGEISAVIHHQDGSTEPAQFSSPDWFGGTPFAYVANGRVSVSSGVLDSLNSGNPRLYAVNVVVTNTTSPTTSIDLTYTSTDGRAVIFALAGTTGAVAPMLITQPNSATASEGQDISFSGVASGTAPITYQWQIGFNGVFTNVANAGNVSGATTTNLSLGSVTAANEAQYRLIASNAGGSATGAVATLTILSSLPNVVHLGDPITPYQPNGGSNPAAENVTNSINGTTDKYLNFGANSGAPFRGPVGFVVSPTIGRTVVTALRFYTANDAVERDPANYVLEGSNDGINWSLISSNALFLPDTRNDTGLEIDPTTQALSQVRFSNTTAYAKYRVSFTHVKDDAAANAMQIGEVELLGNVDTSGFPFFSGEPASVSAFEGGPVSLTATASGVPNPSLRWYRSTTGTNFVLLSDTSNISGSQTGTLNINTASLADIGNYIAVASNSVGSVTSAVARLTILTTNANIISAADVVTAVGDEANGFWGDAANPTNAVDRTATAYVNGGQGFSAPAGFPPFEGPVGLVITPAAGPTRVTGLRIYTASGNPERDPVDYTLEGSINGGTNWTLVSSGPLNLPLARNASDATLDPVSSAMQEVLFPNDSAYSSYRVTFNSVRNPAVANSLQFAELELLGVPSAIVERPRLTITKGANNTIVIDTTKPGMLLSTTNLVNPTWDNEGAITPGGRTITINPAEPVKFYEVSTP